MEPILKIWYEKLNEGKILGLKCTRCGQVMFPPVPVCSKCSGMDTEWVEMSGKGTLNSCGYTATGLPPYHQDPTVIGYATLEEGMIFNATLRGAKKKDVERLAATPHPVTLGIQRMNDSFSFPCLCLADETENTKEK